VAEYAPLFDRLREGGSDAAAMAQKFAQQGIPTEGPALILFEKRLRDSHEPLGLFALANTFGGCVAVCLLITIAHILALRQSGEGWKLLTPFFVAVAVMAWCLLLTKSRTAWLGFACGLLVLLTIRFHSTTRLRRFLLPAGISTAALVVTTTFVLALGGLDRQVLSEAPRSLVFRLQYWQATRRLIADHPWLGVGPGNFRQHYLKYKLPEASEEIADPHNLFFEIAATGGLFSTAGLAGFLALATWSAWKSTRQDVSTSPSSGSALAVDETHWTVFLAASAGPVLALAGSLACWGDWEDRLLVLAAVQVALAWMMSRNRHGSDISDAAGGQFAAPLAALVCLAVHLMGAGGIGMPGVSQFLIAFVAFSSPPPLQSSVSASESGIGGRSFPLAILTLSTASAAIVVALTALPVLRCRSLLRQAEIAAWSSSPTVADYCHRAADADPWSQAPWRQLFEWSMTRDGGGEIRSNESFQAAVKDLHEVLTRDPANFWAPRSLGTLWQERWTKTRNRDDAEQAVLWFGQARDRYPTNSLILADLAFALKAAGDEVKAGDIANLALAQDEIYHQQGHVDRFLNDSVRKRLQAVVTEPQAVP
jgi:O-antigen ligase